MVGKLPPGHAWTPVHGSTVVAAAMYDEAAERIYVRRLDGWVYAFDQCTQRDWDLFLVKGARPGEYLVRVLSTHPYTLSKDE